MVNQLPSSLEQIELSCSMTRRATLPSDDEWCFLGNEGFQEGLESRTGVLADRVNRSGIWRAFSDAICTTSRKPGTVRARRASRAKGRAPKTGYSREKFRPGLSHPNLSESPKSPLDGHSHVNLGSGVFQEDHSTHMQRVTNTQNDWIRNPALIS